MTSSTKPEVRNCHQRMTEPQLHVTCAGNLLKFGRVDFDIINWIDNKQTNRQTNRHANTLIILLHIPTGGKVKMGHSTHHVTTSQYALANSYHHQHH